MADKQEQKQQTSQKSVWIIIGVVAAIAIGVYYYFSRKEVNDRMKKVREAKEANRLLRTISDVSDN